MPYHANPEPIAVEASPHSPVVPAEESALENRQPTTQEPNAPDVLHIVASNSESLTLIYKFPLISQNLRTRLSCDPATQLLTACKRRDPAALPKFRTLQSLPGKPFSFRSLSVPENRKSYVRVMHGLFDLLENSNSNHWSLTQKERFLDTVMDALHEPKSDDFFRKALISFNSQELSAVHGFCLNTCQELGKTIPALAWLQQAAYLAESLTTSVTALANTPEILRNDKNFMMVAVEHNGLFIRHASTALRNDFDVVMAAVKQDCWALRYASAPLKKNRELVLAGLKQNPWAIELRTGGFEDDSEIMLALMAQNFTVISMASERLCNDRDFILTALKTRYDALKYASVALRDDKSIAIAALRKNSMAYGYISARLKGDPEIISLALENHPHLRGRYLQTNANQTT
jgi:hypothetical protein